MSTHESTQNHPIYLVALVGWLCLLASVIFACNWLVDPLWYGEGNRLGDHNFIFNERVSKMNRFLRDPTYDCLMFGDSRVALLNERAIPDVQCINMAFAGGNIRDMVAYAEYLASRTQRVEKVVVGLGPFNFADVELPENSPDFVLDSALPPSIFQSYLSIDLLPFSARSVFGRSPSPIYYDREFRARILLDKNDYDRNPALRTEHQSLFMHTGPFDRTRVPLVDQVIELFPDAEIVGYIPPITADFVEQLQQRGTLDSYVRIIHGIAQRFSGFVDFSIPSAVTRDASNSYDGQHYLEPINDRIASALEEGVDGFGIDVLAYDLDAFRRQYLLALSARPGAIE